MYSSWGINPSLRKSSEAYRLEILSLKRHPTKQVARNWHIVGRSIWYWDKKWLASCDSGPKTISINTLGVIVLCMKESIKHLISSSACLKIFRRAPSIEILEYRSPSFFERSIHSFLLDVSCSSWDPRSLLVKGISLDHHCATCWVPLYQMLHLDQHYFHRRHLHRHLSKRQHANHCLKGINRKGSSERTQVSKLVFSTKSVFSLSSLTLSTNERWCPTQRFWLYCLCGGTWRTMYLLLLHFLNYKVVNDWHKAYEKLFFPYGSHKAFRTKFAVKSHHGYLNINSFHFNLVIIEFLILLYIWLCPVGRVRFGRPSAVSRPVWWLR